MNGRLIGLLLLSAALSGCTPLTGCTDDLQQRLAPTATTLTVGQEVRATGWITGRSPGTTSVTPRGAKYGVLQHVAVTVR